MFKDYEYGWYGFHCSRNGHWMHSIIAHKYIETGTLRTRSLFEEWSRHTKKQLPKIQTVVFIYGDYKECI